MIMTSKNPCRVAGWAKLFVILAAAAAMPAWTLGQDPDVRAEQIQKRAQAEAEALKQQKQAYERQLAEVEKQMAVLHQQMAELKAKAAGMGQPPAVEGKEIHLKYFDKSGGLHEIGGKDAIWVDTPMPLQRSKYSVRTARR